ncbi:MAG: hypothetical protein IPL01_11520 [Acidobacteria bacterium]|nr:hypothetical protein [Acidobacteriota bacterium]
MSYFLSTCPGRHVIAVTSVRSKKATVHNGRIGCCLTTGYIGRRCTPLLSFIVRCARKVASSKEFG